MSYGRLMPTGPKLKGKAEVTPAPDQLLPKWMPVRRRTMRQAHEPQRAQTP
jgi:hypothetical protein